MIKLILIIVLIWINLSSAVEFKGISKQENEKRLAKCEKSEKGGIPWVFKIRSREHKKDTETNGVLISPRHVLTRYTALQNYDGFARGDCKDNIISVEKNHPNQHLIVDFRKCEDDTCRSSRPESRNVVKELIIHPCGHPIRPLVLLELDNDILHDPICLPEHRQIVEKEEVLVLKFHMPSTRIEKATIGPCWQKQLTFCTNMHEANAAFWNETQNDFPMLSLDGETLLAFGDRLGNTQIISFEEILPLHEEIICKVTGVCMDPKKEVVTTLPPPPPPTEPPTTTTPTIPPTPPIPTDSPQTTLEATQAPPTPEASQATQMNQQSPGPTEKSRIIVDWPPPLPTIRPGIREPTVDHLPQTDDEYEYENQLLMEYEQIEKEEREKEKEEKKGTERWNVLVAVGITVLIGLI